MPDDAGAAAAIVACLQPRTYAHLQGMGLDPDGDGDRNEIDLDDDADGVLDVDDTCPNTTIGTPVGADGCDVPPPVCPCVEAFPGGYDGLVTSMTTFRSRYPENDTTETCSSVHYEGSAPVEVTGDFVASVGLSPSLSTTGGTASHIGIMLPNSSDTGMMCSGCFTICLQPSKRRAPKN